MSYGADFVARVEALRRCVVIRRGRRCEDFQGGGGHLIRFMRDQIQEGSLIHRARRT